MGAVGTSRQDEDDEEVDVEEGDEPSCCGIQSPKESCEWPDQGEASTGALLRFLLLSSQRGGADRTRAGVMVGSEGAGEEQAEEEGDEEQPTGVDAMMAQIVAITARSP